MLKNQDYIFRNLNGYNSYKLSDARKRVIQKKLFKKEQNG